jgi:maltose alpha-D-glucosyltransferase/alpha-amylase
MRNSSSLLHWTRRMIHLRKENPAFGMGTFTDIGGSNPCVLSFVRSFGDDIVLCVNNLSRFPQPVELDLREWEGAEPVELLGGAQFPRIGELPYLLTLAGHGFYWLRIPRIPHPDSEPAAATRHELPHEEHATEQPVDVLIPEDGT